MVDDLVVVKYQDQAPTWGVVDLVAVAEVGLKVAMEYQDALEETAMEGQGSLVLAWAPLESLVELKVDHNQAVLGILVGCCPGSLVG